MATRDRLDNLLTEKGLAESREKAKRMILSGAVLVNDLVMDKPGALVAADSIIRVKRQEEFVSRGGLKLREALERFHVSCRGLTAVDVGASTGGFTHCLLEHGTKKVYAVDVGYGQMDWRLRQDPRVTLLERKNARHLTLEDLGDVRPDLAVVDVSFISLKLVTPPVRALLLPGEGRLIALIKPQFEAGKGKVGKGGIIKTPEVLREVLIELLGWFQKEGWEFGGLVSSPILGQKGNREFLIYLLNRSSPSSWDFDFDRFVLGVMDPVSGS